MRQTEQYETGKHGYVTKTQQQKGLATFLSAKRKMSFSSHGGLEEAAITLPGDTCSSRDRAVAGHSRQTRDCFQGPNDCHITSPNTDHFCCCWFSLYKMLRR